MQIMIDIDDIVEDRAENEELQNTCYNCKLHMFCSTHIDGFYNWWYDYNNRKDIENDITKGKFPNCPCVVLPKKHGRLVDVNDLYVHVNGGDYDGAGFSKEYVYCNDIASAPTIIEASGNVK